MLNKVDFPLTTSQISEFVLDKGYTTYFKLQEAISELTQSELIRTETTHNRTLYHLTESGAETIHYFSNKISSAIRTDIDDFLTEKQYDLKEEVSVKADYYLNTNQEYETRCQIVENGFSLIDLGNLHITPYESSVSIPLSFFRIRVCPVHRIGHFLFHQEGTAVSHNDPDNHERTYNLCHDRVFLPLYNARL